MQKFLLHPKYSDSELFGWTKTELIKEINSLTHCWEMCARQKEELVKSQKQKASMQTTSRTQTEAILKHLQEKGSITSFEAISLYGATRLSGIIYSLRKAGYNITTELRAVKNRYGRATSIAIYRLGDVKSAIHPGATRESR